MAHRSVNLVDPSEAEMLELARRGDHLAFERFTGAYRRELHLHCYRMLGSFHDAEDLVQETFVRAWLALDGFESRSSVRTWLYRIATNACLRALTERPRRGLPSGLVPASDPRDPSSDRAVEPLWLEPYPDRLLDELEDPAARYARRETVELAFLATIQLLPPKQRAVLLLRDVLAWSAAEVAELLGASITSVHSALRRARATLASRVPAPAVPAAPTAEERALLNRYVDAFERADIRELVRVLAADVEMTMPPDRAWFRGRSDVLTFLDQRVFAVRGPLLGEPTAANRQPAVALYERSAGVHRALAVHLLSMSSGRVERIDGFVGDTMFPVFGFPTSRRGRSGTRP